MREGQKERNYGRSLKSKKETKRPRTNENK